MRTRSADITKEASAYYRLIGIVVDEARKSLGTSVGQICATFGWDRATWHRKVNVTSNAFTMAEVARLRMHWNKPLDWPEADVARLATPVPATTRHCPTCGQIVGPK